MTTLTTLQDNTIHVHCYDAKLSVNISRIFGRCSPTSSDVTQENGV